MNELLQASIDALCEKSEIVRALNVSNPLAVQAIALAGANAGIQHMTHEIRANALIGTPDGA